MNRLRKKISTRLNSQGGFLKTVSILAGGTAFSQLLAILVLPILTRLYTPNDFSVLAVYLAILGILTSINCLRIEIAIPLPKKR